MLSKDRFLYIVVKKIVNTIAAKQVHKKASRGLVCIVLLAALFPALACVEHVPPYIPTRARMIPVDDAVFQTKKYQPVEGSGIIFHKKKYEADGRHSQTIPSEVFVVTAVQPEPGSIVDCGIPAISVGFSSPAVPLSFVGKEIRFADYVKISPPVRGHAMWTGSSTLVLLPAKPLDPAVNWTLEVNQEVTALDGTPFSGSGVFSFSTGEFDITNVYWKASGKWIGGGSLEKIPAAASSLGIEFTHPVSVAGVKDSVMVLRDGIKGKVRMSGDYPGYLTPLEGRRFVSLELPADISPGERLTIAIEKGSQLFPWRGGISGSVALEVRITEDLFIERAHFIGTKNGTPLNALEIVFNTPLSNETDCSLITVSPELNRGKAYWHTDGNTLRLMHTGWENDTQYILDIKSGFRGKYGTITGDTSVSIAAPPFTESKALLPSGNGYFLESSFRPTILFSRYNVAHGQWAIRSLDKLYSFLPASLMKPYPGLTTSSYTASDYVDLSAYLDSRQRGAVGITWNMEKPLWGNYHDPAHNKMLSLQFTDIGVSIRYAFNGAAVHVSSLTSAEALNDAKVALMSGDRTIITSFTDNEGIVYFDFGQDSFTGLFGTLQSADSFGVLVRHGGDEVYFKPRGEQLDENRRLPLSPWYLGDGYKAAEITTDRSEYVPGNTIYAHGVAYSRARNTMLPYQGKYAVALINNKTPWLYERVVYGTAGYFGYYNTAIDVPHDLQPGGYRVKFIGANRAAEHKFRVNEVDQAGINLDVSIPDRFYSLDDSLNCAVSISKDRSFSLEGYHYSYKLEAESMETGHSFPLAASNEANECKQLYSSPPIPLFRNGTFKLPMQLSAPFATKKAAQYTLTVTVFRNTKAVAREKRILKAYPAAWQFVFTPDAGPDMKYHVSTIHKRVSGTYAIESRNEAYPVPNRLSNDVYVSIFRVNSNRKRLARLMSSKQLFSKGRVSFIPGEAGLYEIFLEGPDPEGQLMETSYWVFVTGEIDDNYRSEASTCFFDSLTNSSRVGDSLEFIVYWPFDSAAGMLTVEREGLLDVMTVPVKKGISIIQIPSKSEYVPGAVFMLQAGASAVAGRQGYYFSPTAQRARGFSGSVDITVEPSDMDFDVSVSLNNDRFLPGEKSSLSVKAADRNGKPLRVLASYWIVASGAEFHPGDYLSPLSSSFHGVYGDDTRRLLLGAQKNILHAQGNQVDPSPFNVVDFQLNSEITEHTGSTIGFTVPENPGKYKIIIAVKHHRQVQVKRVPLEVFSRPGFTIEAPAVVRERDIFTVKVNFHEQITGDQEYQLSIEADEGIEILDEPHKSFQISKMKEKYAAYQLYAASSGSVQAVIVLWNTDIELKQKVAFNILPNTALKYHTVTDMTGIDPEMDAASLVLAIPKGIEHGHAKLSFVFSNDYRAYIQPALARLGLASGGSVRGTLYDLYSEIIRGRLFPWETGKDNIRQKLDEAGQLQHQTGGYKLSRSFRDTDILTTALAGYVMTTASKHSYEIPESFSMKRLYSALAGARVDAGRHGARVVLFTEYVKSLMGGMITDSVHSIYADAASLSPSNLMMLALVYSQAGFHSRMNECVRLADSRFTEQHKRYFSIDESAMPESERLLYVALRLLLSKRSIVFVNTDNLVHDLMISREDGFWGDEFTSMIVVSALELYTGSDTEAIDYTISLRDQILLRGAITPSRPVGIHVYAPGDNTVLKLRPGFYGLLDISSDSRSGLSWLINSAYCMPSEVLERSESGVSIFSWYSDISSRPAGMILQYGNKYYYTTMVHAPGETEELVARVPLPAGVRHIDTQIYHTDIVGVRQVPRKAGDDVSFHTGDAELIVTASGKCAGGLLMIRSMVTASHRGMYVVPNARVFSYDKPEFKAGGSGSVVEIR